MKTYGFIRYFQKKRAETNCWPLHSEKNQMLYMMGTMISEMKLSQGNGMWCLPGESWSENTPLLIIRSLLKKVFKRTSKLALSYCNWRKYWMEKCFNIQGLQYKMNIWGITGKFLVHLDSFSENQFVRKNWKILWAASSHEVMECPRNLFLLRFHSHDFSRIGIVIEIEVCRWFNAFLYCN